jgi:hypothetical protein
MNRIVFTRPDGGVSITQPSQEFMDWLSNGGYFKTLAPGIIEPWIELKISQGRDPGGVKKFAIALRDGGHSTAECYGLMRDFECLHKGTGFELWSLEDIPADRWFRNAWIRSPNGGPIDIDMDAARKIQFSRVKGASDEENEKRKSDLKRFDDLIDLPWGKIRDQIQAAEEPKQLRSIWPQELSKWQ